jgi:hypothetical protein
VWLVKIPPRVRKAGVGPDEERTHATTELRLREAFRDPFDAGVVVTDDTPRKTSNIFGPLYASSFKVKLPVGTHVLYRGNGLFGLPTVTMVSIKNIFFDVHNTAPLASHSITHRAFEFSTVDSNF